MPGLCCNHHSRPAWGRFCAAGQWLLWTFVLFPQIFRSCHVQSWLHFFLLQRGSIWRAKGSAQSLARNLWLFFDFFMVSLWRKNNHCNITWRRDNAGLQQLSPAHHIYPPCYALCIIWHTFSLLRVGNCTTVILSLGNHLVYWVKCSSVAVKFGVFLIWCCCTHFWEVFRAEWTRGALSGLFGDRGFRISVGVWISHYSH